ncbi:MAG: trypsin-like peptidase domain-containing protein [Clostridia bacterium]|nr:trypsin-like peptidase domain-containing protein [Clostridia bacterium]
MEDNFNNNFSQEENGFYSKSSDEIVQDDFSHEEKREAYAPASNNYSYNSGNYYPPYNPKPKRKKKSYGLGTVVLSVILAAVVGAVSACFVMPRLSTGNTEKGGSIIPSPNNVNINIDETAQNIVEAVAVKVTPSVVGIRTTTSVVSFFGGGNEQMGEGSGVIYSSDGYIITNYHVIADAISNSGGKIEVFLDSDTEKSHTAQVVGYNISTDLAVIKIDAKGLQKAEIGNSDELKLGQYVITVGNPGGLEFMDSVTYGVISGLDRIVSSDSDLKLIQTDAAINPGNSGGALVNAKGQLVGINSSKIVSEEYEGMGFAIPVKKVIEVCDGIIERENAPEPYVGISISERYTADVLSFYGYPTGAVVLSVAETSPAENAGIRRGDIITKFKGTTLNSYEMFEQLLSECSPGEKVNAEIYRSGKYYSTEITIGSNS